MRLQLASDAHEYQRVDARQIIVILFDQMTCARCWWQNSSSSSVVFHLTFVRRLGRRQFLSLPLSLYVCVCYVHKRTSSRGEREKKKTVAVRFWFVGVLCLASLFLFSSPASFLSFSPCLSHFLSFAVFLILLCALVCLSLDALAAAVLCLVHHIYSTFVCLSTGAAIHFPHHCIFPSRRRCCCITDGARQCPLLVLIYYSLLYWSSNNEVGCKSKMVAVFSYHSVENRIFSFDHFSI